MVSVLFEGGGGGQAKAAAGRLTANDGAGPVLSFAANVGDVIRGFRVHVFQEGGGAVGAFRVYASIGEYRAALFNDVFQAGANLIVDMLDASGGSDWANVSGSGQIYCHVNFLVKQRSFLNIVLKSDITPIAPGFLVSADIVPREIVRLCGGVGLMEVPADE